MNRKNTIEAISAGVLLSLILSAGGLYAVKGEIFRAPSTEVNLVDVNGDGENTAADYNELKYQLLHGVASKDADLNGDGKTDTKDYILYKQQCAYDRAEQLKDEAEEYGFDYQREDGRVLVWHDEFDGDSINSDNWHFQQTMGGADHHFDNSEKYATVKDGNLELLAEYDEDNPNQPYVLPEGIVTANTMNYRYGYAEIESQITFAHGAWPSWWMKGHTVYQKAPCWAEIDVYEVFGSKYQLASALHKWSSNTVVYENPLAVLNTYVNGDYDFVMNGWRYTHQIAYLRGTNNKYNYKNFTNLTNEFHVYGFDWTDDEMSFYVDGEFYVRYYVGEDDDWDSPYALDLSSMVGPMQRFPGMDCFDDYIFMIFNNELLTPGNGTSKGYAVKEDFPIHYRVNYMRIWQNPETDGIHLKDDIATETKILVENR